jgi:hypothetical protein
MFGEGARDVGIADAGAGHAIADGVVADQDDVLRHMRSSPLCRKHGHAHHDASADCKVLVAPVMAYCIHVAGRREAHNA